MQPDDPKPNQRRSRRRAPRRQTRVRCHKGEHGFGPNIAVALEDLSAEGCRFVTSLALQQGQYVEVNLESLDVRGAVRVLARVVWVEPLDASRCRVGTKFEHPVQYRALQQLARP